MKGMDPEQERAASFIKQLWANGALDGFTALQKEEQILRFLRDNALQLVPLLASPRFFPAWSWERILDLLRETLRAETDRILMPQLDSLVQGLDLAFLSFLQPQHAPAQEIREQMLLFLKRLLQNPTARAGFSGPCTAVLLSLSDPYLDETFASRQYVHFELTKVQRLTMGKGEIKQYLKAALLLRAGIQVLSAGAAGEGLEAGSGVVQFLFAEKVLRLLREQLKAIPAALLKTAAHSSLSYQEVKTQEATARLAAIFAVRGRTYQQLRGVDRGARGPERSWFNIARRNYKYYGFDSKMLDELYKIAANHGW